VSDLKAVAVFIEPFVRAAQLLPRTIDELESLLPFGYVAQQGEKIVGFSSLEVYSKKLAEIRSLAVCPECRGRGIGKQLVAACVERAREEDVFEVMAITANENIFEACGFGFTLPGQKKALFVQTRADHG